MSINRVILGLHVAAMLIVVTAWLTMVNMEQPNTFFSMNPAYERVAIVRGAFTFVAFVRLHRDEIEAQIADNEAA